MPKFVKLTHTEIQERTRVVAEKCYYKILAAELAALDRGEKLSTLKRLDIYQSYRDRACNRINQDIMFWEDYFDLFDTIYKEVEIEKELDALICC